MRLLIPLALCAGVLSLALAGSADAQTPKVGDTVTCYGSTGPIIRTDPRPGWDEPFYIVRTPNGDTNGELKCLPRDMKPASPAAATATGPTLCRPGAKIEAAWGISWYAVTVLKGLNAANQCLVHFDGYASSNDNLVSGIGLRPRGSGPIVRPLNPVNETPAQKAAQAAPLPARAPDGAYRCHKISPGGQLQDIGVLNIRGGQGTLAGLPAGWRVRGIAPIGRNDRGQLIVAYDYTSASGFNDRLDCVR